ncbi:hypothetical protein C0995_011236, partial [Termitomyces sp. Mi166
MDQNCNPWFIVRRRPSTGQKPVQGPTGDTPVTKENWHAPRAGQPVQKGWDGPPWVNPPRISLQRLLLEVTQDTSQVLQQHDATTVAELVTMLKIARRQKRKSADSNAESNAEEDQEELVKDKEVPPEVEDLEAEYDAESVHIDGDEYIMVD